MEARVEAIRDGRAPGLVWLLEHPPVYTAGTSARAGELLHPGTAEVVRDAGRGGRWTYHGPGQRVAYVVRDLRPSPDLRAYVQSLERWVAAALALHGIEAGPRNGRVGLWTRAEEKVAALGVRVRRGVAYHGVAVNVDPDLAAFAGIVPCGLPGYGVTSVAREIGRVLPVEFCDGALKRAWADVFGGALTETPPPPLSAGTSR
jgi:lipoyl(octanoyl) transferase